MEARTTPWRNGQPDTQTFWIIKSVIILMSDRYESEGLPGSITILMRAVCMLDPYEMTK